MNCLSHLKFCSFKKAEFNGLKVRRWFVAVKGISVTKKTNLTHPFVKPLLISQGSNAKAAVSVSLISIFRLTSEGKYIDHRHRSVLGNLTAFECLDNLSSTSRAELKWLGRLDI